VKLRDEVRRLRAELEDTADKVFHWMKRHSARASREAAVVETEAAGASGTDGGAQGASVSPRIAALIRRRQNAHLADGNP
jgi:hypothetical protein